MDALKFIEERNRMCDRYWQADGDCDDCPLPDAVQVVRCEDCLFWKSGKNECESWEWCTMLDRDMPPHAFCNLGVRKDEERNER